jgi:hypothetical protein
MEKNNKRKMKVKKIIRNNKKSKILKKMRKRMRKKMIKEIIKKMKWINLQKNRFKNKNKTKRVKIIQVYQNKVNLNNVTGA